METIVVEDVLARMGQLTRDLIVIRTAINNQVLQAKKSLNPDILSKSDSNGEMIAQFRAAIDDLRHVVWLYSETIVNRREGARANPSKLLARAAEIMHALSVHPPLPRLDSTTCGASFIERFLHLMERSIDLKVPGKSGLEEQFNGGGVQGQT